MLKIQEIKNKKIWETFLQKRDFYPFFQSWEWGEVQQKMGISIKRLGMYDKDALIGIMLCTYIKAKRGNYMHLRHGPVLKEYKKEYLNFIFNYLSQSYKDVSFIRCSPLITKSSYFSFPKFINAAIHRMDAEVCWVLDVTPSLDILLSQMRKSHRYLIKKAQKEPITIIKSTKKEDMERFLPLYKNLAKRKHFVAHKGVQEEFEVFSKEKKAVLFLAVYDNKVISGALIDFVGNMAIYRHSASDEAYKNVPAMYLLQWNVIQEAKKRGMKYYNFWGISNPVDKKHPWYGLTLFKTGFGGTKYEFMHAKDMPLNLGYLKTYAIEFFSKIRKGY